MWKEKYTALSERLQVALGLPPTPADMFDDSIVEAVQHLREAHDKLATAAESKPPEYIVHTKKASNGGGAVDYDSIFRYVKQRAASDPGVLQLLREQPELVVKVTKPVLDVDGSSLFGRMAQLIQEGFFKSAKTYDAATDEAIRRGWCSTKTPKIRSREYLDKLAGMGFLTREADGYLQVTSAKVRVAEA
jgi:hypothetical protein